MFHLVNFPNHYEFVKTDNQGNPLPGVRFTLKDGNGIVRISDLKKGKYIIREIETLEGFVRTDETIVVEINEKYIDPDEMYHLINYPVIKTGTELTSPYLWVGVGVAGLALIAGIVLVVLKKKKSKVK